jgi:1-acyl-sn-glycerol-3-phosphate acyltransferase
VSAMYRMAKALARVVVPLQARLRATHADRVPRQGSVLLVCNHLGPTDPVAVGLRINRTLSILAKAEIFEWPVFGWIAHRCGAVPIRRGASDREALRTLKVLLEQGQCVLVFPEGTYSDPPAPAAMLPVKTGAAWLALRTGAVVVPVAICGTERIWVPQRGWRVWKRPHVLVTFGEPYHPQVPHGISTRAALQAVADDMALRIAALLPEAYRGQYSDAVATSARAQLTTLARS